MRLNENCQIVIGLIAIGLLNWIWITVPSLGETTQEPNNSYHSYYVFDRHEKYLLGQEFIEFLSEQGIESSPEFSKYWIKLLEAKSYLFIDSIGKPIGKEEVPDTADTAKHQNVGSLQTEAELIKLYTEIDSLAEKCVTIKEKKLDILRFIDNLIKRQAANGVFFYATEKLNKRNLSRALHSLGLSKSNSKSTAKKFSKFSKSKFGRMGKGAAFGFSIIFQGYIAYSESQYEDERHYRYNSSFDLSSLNLYHSRK